MSGEDRYILDIGRIDSCDGYSVHDTIVFVQPNRDTDPHMIVAMGLDSDDDVWVRLETGETFFDWREYTTVIR